MTRVAKSFEKKKVKAKTVSEHVQEKRRKISEDHDVCFVIFLCVSLNLDKDPCFFFFSPCRHLFLFFFMCFIFGGLFRYFLSHYLLVN